MKRAYGRFFIIVLILPWFLSCTNPAIMVMDPASNAFYDWQGQGRSVLSVAASQAGYHLIICDLNATQPISEQIDAAWKRDGGPAAVMVYPPILSAEAVASLGRFPAKATILLASRPANYTDSGKQFLTVDIDRTNAFQTLGAKTAGWLQSNPLLRVKGLFLVDEPARQSELDSLWIGFEQANGDRSRFLIQSWETAPVTAELRTIYDGIKSDPNMVLLLFLGLSDKDFVINLGDWSGRIVGEQIGAISDKMTNIVASIDVRWDVVLEGLLKKTNTHAATPQAPLSLSAELHLYNEYLKK